MLFYNNRNRPAIRCGRCCNEKSIAKLLAIRFEGISAVSFVCESCATTLAERNNKFERQPAIEFFKGLLSQPPPRPGL